MTLARILRVLSVLDIRFQRTYVHTSNMDWHRPFDIDISFINNLCDSASPVDLARTLTSYDLNAFANLSPRNIIDGDEVSQQYLARRHLLSLSVWECCSALSDWIVFIQECVQVSIFSLGDWVVSKRLISIGSTCQSKLSFVNGHSERPSKVQHYFFNAEQRRHGGS